MKTKEIIALGGMVKQLTAENAHCYLWTTNNHLKDGLEILEAWGFRYVTMITWVKGVPPIDKSLIGYKENKSRVPLEVYLYRAGHTCTDIGNLIGVCEWTIRYRLKKYGEPIRQRGKLLNVELLNNRQKQVIDGEMLGDGHLSLRGAYKNAHLDFHFKNIEHCELLMEELHNLNPNITRRRDILPKIGWRLWTNCNEDLTEQQKRWYKSNIKIVPDDLKLTPLVCFHWYIGDGHLTKDNGIVLYSLSFTYDENVFLVKKLEEVGFKTNIHKKMYPSGIKYSIYIPKKYVAKFLKWIGSPVGLPCYYHKWGNPEDLLNGKRGNISLGQYYRGLTEHILFGIKGMLPYKLLNGKRQQGLTGYFHKKGKHSEKPELFREVIEKVSYPPYIELFARKKTENWTVWGNEITKEKQEMQLKLK